MISMDHGPSWLLIIRSSEHRRWAVLTCRWPSLCWTAPPAGPWPLKASCFPTTCCLMGMVRDGIPGHSGEHAGHASLIELLYRAPRFFEGFLFFVLEVDFVDGQRAVDLNEMQCRMIGFNVPKQTGWWKLDDVCAKVWRTGIIQDFTYQNDLINQSRCKIGILQKKMKWIWSTLIRKIGVLIFG